MKKILFLIAVLVGCASSAEQRYHNNDVSNKKSALDLTDDPDNCGVEGYQCVGGRTCVSSRCSPSWIGMTTTGAPSARGMAAAGSINNKFIMTGGCESTTPYSSPSSTSYSYDPSLDSWSSFYSIDAARSLHSMASSKNALFVVGGINNCYNGAATGPELEMFYAGNSSWITFSSANTPLTYELSTVWTGKSLFTFGGAGNGYPSTATATEFSLEDGWKDISCPLSGCNRTGEFNAFMDGDNIRIMGGFNLYGNAPNGLNYNLKSSRWNQWNIPATAPDFTTYTDHIPFKMADDGNRIFILSTTGTVFIYNKTTGYWTEDSTDPVPTGFCQEAATAWVGKELIAWGGFCAGVISSVGGRYQPPAL